MTEQEISDRRSAPLPRSMGWVVIVCAAVSFALTVVARFLGPVRWTAWALPLLITANAAVFFLGALNARPRLVRPFIGLSLAVAIAVIVSEGLLFFHR